LGQFATLGKAERKSNCFPHRSDARIATTLIVGCLDYAGNLEQSRKMLQTEDTFPKCWDKLFESLLICVADDE
jgi:hypothetical protein